MFGVHPLRCATGHDIHNVHVTGHTAGERLRGLPSSDYITRGEKRQRRNRIGPSIDKIHPVRPANQISMYNAVGLRELQGFAFGGFLWTGLTFERDDRVRVL